MKEQKFRLHIQKKFFILRVVVHWQRLLREAACAPSLAVSRAGLDRPVRLELDGLYGHFQLKPFYVSMILEMLDSYIRQRELIQTKPERTSFCRVPRTAKNCPLYSVLNSTEKLPRLPL